MKKTVVSLAFCLLLIIPLLSVSAAADAETTISIEILSGIPFLGITTGWILINTGDKPAYNISYTWHIRGGINGQFNITDTGFLEEIPPGLAIAFGGSYVSGFGPVVLTMTATASNADSVTRSVRGVLLGRIVWIPLSWILPPILKDYIPWLNWDPAHPASPFPAG